MVFFYLKGEKLWVKRHDADLVLKHELEAGHPESPERLKAILEQLKQSGLQKRLSNVEPSGDAEVYIKDAHNDDHVSLLEGHDNIAVAQLVVEGVMTGLDQVLAEKHVMHSVQYDRRVSCCWRLRS